MGLDLQLFAKKKVPKENEVNEVDLSYSRKTWSIAYMFDGAVQAEGADVLVSFNNYMKVISILKHFTIEEYRTISGYEYGENDEEELYQKFVDWYNETFDESPQLGYSWEANAYASWLDDVGMVLTYFFDPEWEVYIYASY